MGETDRQTGCGAVPPGDDSPHLSQALSNQQKAVLMSERVMGIEHPNTIQEYVSSRRGRGRRRGGAGADLTCPAPADAPSAVLLCQ